MLPARRHGAGCAAPNPRLLASKTGEVRRQPLAGLVITIRRGARAGTENPGRRCARVWCGVVGAAGAGFCAAQHISRFGIPAPDARVRWFTPPFVLPSSFRGSKELVHWTAVRSMDRLLHNWVIIIKQETHQGKHCDGQTRIRPDQTKPTPADRWNALLSAQTPRNSFPALPTPSGTVPPPTQTMSSPLLLGSVLTDTVVCI